MRLTRAAIGLTGFSRPVNRWSRRRLEQEFRDGHLSMSPITARWPAAHPDRIQLYSTPTPNGVKVSIALEEPGLAYEPHLIDIGRNETWTTPFLSLNPSGKIPAIIDPEGPGGRLIGMFESGAILLYFAEKPESSSRPTRRGGGADVRAARLLPQIRRAGLRG